jgi:type IV secretory pathway TrbF-like protein
MAEALKGANRANRRHFVIEMALILVCGFLYRSTRVEIYAREVDENGVALRTTHLERVTDATQMMRRDGVQRFFRGLRTASSDLKYQALMSKTALALTAGGSPAHQLVEAFGARELPQRLEQEIEVQVTAHPISDNKWRAEIVEHDRTGERRIYTAYATVDVAVEAERDVDLNPWGVFVRDYSLDTLVGDVR